MPPMTDPMELVGRATEASDLRDRIMNPNVAKSEAEWWAAREIERLEACIREMVEWRPIETAPRDGTEIVGFDRRTGTGHVTSADQWGRWVDPDSHYYSEAEPFKPTHWLPLPPAPGAEA